MHIGLSLILVVLFLAMNAFFVIAEFALVRVRKSQLELAVEQGKKGAKSAMYIAENVNQYLSACQLGITLASLAIGWLGEPAVSSVIHEPLAALGLPDAAVSAIAVAIGFIIITALHVILGELVPKSMAILNTERYALFSATPLYWFYRITYPIMWLFNSITNGVMKLLGHDIANEHEVYTDEEIKLLIDESTESGLIDPEQNEYVDNIFDLGDKDAEAIMTPRMDMICLDTEDTLEENLELIHEHKYTRYPVCSGSKDNVIGFVHVKDLFDQERGLPLEDWNIRELPAVPETLPIARLLDTLRENRTGICQVIDEHGGTAGIVTMSDVFEQIVGRVDDEYYHDDEEEEVVELSDGNFEIDGALAIDDLEEIIGFRPEQADEVETVGGLFMALTDGIPDEGDVAEMDHYDKHVKFTLLSMDRHRIDKIRCVVTVAESEDEED